jgi:hypothetical protein
MQIPELRQLRQVGGAERFTIDLRTLMPQEGVLLFDPALSCDEGVGRNILLGGKALNGNDRSNVHEELLEGCRRCAVDIQPPLGQRRGEVYEFGVCAQGSHERVRKIGWRKGC